MLACDRSRLHPHLLMLVRSFTGVSYSWCRLVVAIALLIAIDVVLSRTEGERKLDDATENEPRSLYTNHSDNLVCRLVRERGRPLVLENRMD